MQAKETRETRVSSVSGHEKMVRPSKSALSSRARARRRTIAALVEEYLLVHQSEAHSKKAIEWHSTALRLLVRFLNEQNVCEPLDFETSHLRHWVVWLGTPESVRQRPNRRACTPRSKRTIHTYTRSAHAFCKWLFEEGYTDVDVTDHFALPKVGKPLIRILEEDELQRLLAACENGQQAYPQYTLSLELRAFAERMEEIDEELARDYYDEIREKARMLGRPVPMI